METKGEIKTVGGDFDRLYGKTMYEYKYTIYTIYGHQKHTNWYAKAVCIKFLFDCFYSGVAVIKKNY